MKELIENTTTKAGLKVFACIFNRIYETGRKVVEGFKESMRIVFDKHLGNGIMLPFLKRQSQKLPKLFYALS